MRLTGFLVIADDEDEATLDASVPLDPPPDPPDINSPTSNQISLHSFSCHVAPETLRLLGHIANHQVMILVDGGSTHNFIQEPLVQQLGLSPQATAPL